MVLPSDGSRESAVVQLRQIFLHVQKVKDVLGLRVHRLRFMFGSSFRV
jgi:hypothetical protein